jgi:hypothetical protein
MTPQTSSKVTESIQAPDLLRSLSMTTPKSGAEQAGEPVRSTDAHDEANRDVRYRIISVATYQIYTQWE